MESRDSLNHQMEIESNQVVFKWKQVKSYKPEFLLASAAFGSSDDKNFICASSFVNCFRISFNSCNHIHVHSGHLSQSCTVPVVQKYLATKLLSFRQQRANACLWHVNTTSGIMAWGAFCLVRGRSRVFHNDHDNNDCDHKDMEHDSISYCTRAA